MKSGFSFLIIILSLSFGSTVQGEVYKWVDAQGKMHFSDYPPEQVKKSRLKIESSAEPYSRAADRERMEKYILIHLDGNLKIRLIRETDEMLVFDVEYFHMQKQYPDIDYENVRLMIEATSTEAIKQKKYSFIGFRYGVIKEDTGSLRCKIYKTERTPDNFATDTLHINLFQGEAKKGATGYKLSRKIVFEKVWRDSSSVE